MLERKQFREDLYFRLKVFPIVIPPLRERKSDIPALVHYFVQKKSREMGLADIPGLAPGAMSALTAYHWPGNVRELENAVERALILSGGEALTFSDPALVTAEEQQPEGVVKGGHSLELDTVVSNHIIRVLDMTHGKVHGKSGAAFFLNVNPSTLRKRMRKLGIPFGQRWKKG
jgi:transcriptional regulator with GAF, ATPase, and Fis domain